MHNLVRKHLKLIPLIQLRGLGERCKVPKRVGRPAAKRYLVHFELRKAAGESNFMCIFTEEIPNASYVPVPLQQFSILVDMNDCYKMIVNLTSLYKLRNIKWSGFEIKWVNNFYRGISGRALAPSAPSCVRPCTRLDLTWQIDRRKWLESTYRRLFSRENAIELREYSGVALINTSSAANNQLTTITYNDT